ncbi:MAG TPA: GNAT family N-acetyltransferase [Micromonospora sp.]
MDPVEIIEDGLLLRPLRPEDTDTVYQACQDPDIGRWTGVPRPYLLEHAAGWITDIAPRAWREGTGAPFAVCDADTGEFLGTCGLVSIDRVLRSAEIGYWTAPWARGRGVAVRACRALARWAFEELDLRRLTWQAEVGNHASRLVALRTGFRLEGRLRLADPRPYGRRDGWIASLLPGEVTGAGEDPVRADVRRRATVFGRPQPVLFATAGAREIRLRPLEERDLDDITTTCQDPEVRRWTTVPDPYRRSDAEFFLREVAGGNWAAGTGAVFTIADPDDRYAGSMELRLSPGDPQLADVGFMVAPWARGRGYCPAALAAVCAWGFTALGLARVEWRANVGNHASRRAAEKAGFVFEGTARGRLPHRGERVDAWVAALLARDLTR